MMQFFTNTILGPYILILSVLTIMTIYVTYCLREFVRMGYSKYSTDINILLSYRINVVVVVGLYIVGGITLGTFSILSESYLGQGIWPFSTVAEDLKVLWSLIV